MGVVDTSSGPGGLQSVDRALHVLELLAAWGSGGVSELAGEIGVHKSTAFRLLGALEARDLTLCAAMARCPICGLVGRGFGSRATLYRRLRNLRCVLTAHGARAA